MKNLPLSLILDPSLKNFSQKLYGNGIITAEQFKNTPDERLIDYIGSTKVNLTDLKLSIKKMKEIIENLPRVITQEQKLHTYINESEISFSISQTLIDSPINKAIRKSEITEILAPCGYGKTTLIFSTLINQIKSQLSDQNFLYADCNGLFDFKRIKNLINNNLTPSQSKELLSRIIFKQIQDYTSLLFLVKQLPQQIEENKKISIVILDGLLNCFNMFNDEIFRLQAALYEIFKELNKLSKQTKIAILIANSVPYQDKESFQNRTQFDHYYSGFIENKLHIIKYQKCKYLVLKKSSQQKCDQPNRFSITDKGIEFDNLFYKK